MQNDRHACFDRLYRQLLSISRPMPTGVTTDPAVVSMLASLAQLEEIPHCILGPLADTVVFYPLFPDRKDSSQSQQQTGGQSLARQQIQAPDQAPDQGVTFEVWLIPPGDTAEKAWQTCLLAQLLGVLAEHGISLLICRAPDFPALQIAGDLLHKLILVAATCVNKRIAERQAGRITASGAVAADTTITAASPATALEETMYLVPGTSVTVSQPEHELPAELVQKAADILGSDTRIAQAFLFNMSFAAGQSVLTLGLVPAGAGTETDVGTAAAAGVAVGTAVGTAVGAAVAAAAAAGAGAAPPVTVEMFLPAFYAIFGDWDGNDDLFTHIDLVLLDSPEFLQAVQETVAPLDLHRT